MVTYPTGETEHVGGFGSETEALDWRGSTACFEWVKARLIELDEITAKLREIEAGIGDGVKSGPRLEEQEMYTKGRRSLHVVRDVRAGEKVSLEDLIVKRPGLGISPRLRDQVVGRTAKTDIPADHWVTWDLLV